MTMNTVGPVPHPRFPLSGVTPFTYRDGWTYLEVLENFRRWIRDELVPIVNDNAEKMDAAYEAALDVFLDAVAKIADAEQAVLDVQAIFDELQANGPVVSVDGAHGIVELDPLIAEHVSDLGSDTYQGIASGFATRKSSQTVLNIGESANVIGDGVTDDSDALQAALDEAFQGGLRAVAQGEFRTTKTLHIRGNVDLSDAHIYYEGIGTAIVVGEPTAGIAVHDMDIRLPRLTSLMKDGTGWPVMNTGVQIVNLNSSGIHVPLIENFGVGLLVYGNDYGTCYNTITLGWLLNNKQNLRMDKTSTGWVNQNTFIGGRYMIVGNEGANIPGARHIIMTSPENPTYGGPNNNLFLNPSLEGIGPEYHADFDYASHNRILNGRWEVSGGQSARVRWNTGQRNTIEGGYGVDAIEQTFTAESNGLNSIHGSSSASIVLTAQGQLFENRSLGPIATYLDAGGIKNGDDPDTQYVAQFGYSTWRGKRRDDAHDRVRVEASNGRIYLGSGSQEPAAYLQAGAGGLLFAGGFLGAATDNTTDIGLSANFRPRDIHVARDIRVAGEIRIGTLRLRDNDGTLEVLQDGTWKPVQLGP